MKSKVVVWAGFIFFVLLVVFPVLWGIRTSFAPRYNTEFIPAKFTLEHYTNVLSRKEFIIYLRNSLIVALGTLAITLPTALFGGYALAKFDFPGRKMGILFLILPLLPPIAILVPLLTYINKLNLYNSLLALIVANTTFNLPFAVWMTRGFISMVPNELEEAAMLDGCSRIGAFLRIVIPLTFTGLLAVGAFVFIMTWNNYLYAFAFISSPTKKVLPQAILGFIGQWGTNWGGLTAAGNLAILPPLILFLLFQRWFIKGMTEGAVE